MGRCVGSECVRSESVREGRGGEGKERLIQCSSLGKW